MSVAVIPQYFSFFKCEYLLTNYIYCASMSHTCFAYFYRVFLIYTLIYLLYAEYLGIHSIILSTYKDIYVEEVFQYIRSLAVCIHLFMISNIISILYCYNTNKIIIPGLILGTPYLIISCICTGCYQTLSSSEKQEWNSYNSQFLLVLWQTRFLAIASSIPITISCVLLARENCKSESNTEEYQYANV